MIRQEVLDNLHVEVQPKELVERFPAVDGRASRRLVVNPVKGQASVTPGGEHVGHIVAKLRRVEKEPTGLMLLDKELDAQKQELG